jgi:hypothetical protein
MRASIKDATLADQVEAVEDDESADAPESRVRIRAAVEEHYTIPATDEGAR